MSGVVFGDRLIFHAFPAREQAETFAAAVRLGYERDAAVYDDADEAADVAVFPYQLEAPVVLVARDERWTRESEIEASAAAYGGRFAGT